MKKLTLMSVLLILIVGACAPTANVDADAQIKLLQEGLNQAATQISAQQTANAHAHDEMVAQQGRADAIATENAVLLTEQAVVPSDTPTPTATPTEKGKCAIREHFGRLNFGFSPQLGGNKKDELTVEIGCVLMTIYFPNGSYLFGQISTDGRQFFNETCQYYDVYSGKTWTGSEKRVGCQFEWKGDPIDLNHGQLSAQIKLFKKNNDSPGTLCLAEEWDDYSKTCREHLGQ